MLNLLNSLVAMFQSTEPKISPHQLKTLRYNDCIKLLYDVTRKIGLRPKIIHSQSETVYSWYAYQDELVLKDGSKISCGIHDQDNSIFTIDLFPN
jgi:hypothetical protein